MRFLNVIVANLSYMSTEIKAEGFPINKARDLYVATIAAMLGRLELGIQPQNDIVPLTDPRTIEKSRSNCL
jgi:hypothetical protein